MMDRLGGAAWVAPLSRALLPVGARADVDPNGKVRRRPLLLRCVGAHNRIAVVAALFLACFLAFAAAPLGRRALRAMQPEAGKTREEVLLPLLDLRPNAVKNPDSIAVCFQFSTILATGGIEAWFWALFDGVFSQGPFSVHAVQLNDYWSPEVAARFVRAGVIFNPGQAYLVDTCDVIVLTGSQPLPEPPLQRRVPRVLVIHGSKGCQWTWRYAKHAARFDAIVGVSRGAVAVLDSLPEQAARARVIPAESTVNKLVAHSGRQSLLLSWGVPLHPNLRILLYLGRISSEKNPQYFMDVVEALPPNWVGLMVGPAYFDASFPQRSSPRVIMTGHLSHAADPLSVADVALLASPTEGGPIVLLEAWAMRVPFFMRRTGLAAEHPQGVFILEDDESPAHAAARVEHVAMHREDASVRSVVDAGYSTVTGAYAIGATSRQWSDLLLNVTSARHSCRSYSHELRFQAAPDRPAVLIAVDGHHRILSAVPDSDLETQADGAPPARHADVSLAAAALACQGAWVNGVRVRVELTVQQLGDGPASEPVGELELLEVDVDTGASAGGASAGRREPRVLARAPLVPRGLRDVASLDLAHGGGASSNTPAAGAAVALRVRLRSGASVRISDVQLSPLGASTLGF